VNGGALASGVAMTKLAKIDSGDFLSDFSLDWALKDLAQAVAGVESMRVAAAIAERWRRLVSEGYGPSRHQRCPQRSRFGAHCRQ